MDGFSSGRKRYYNLQIPPAQRLEVRELLLSHQNEARLKASLPLFPNLRVLVVEDAQMKHFPEEICQLHFLEELSLKNNQIAFIPEQIKCLKQLKKLNLSGNQLKKWPAQILEMPQLQYLDLSNNGLTEIPSRIKELSHLKELHLSDNQFIKTPLTIGRLSQLKYIDLSHNRIKRLPKAIGKCTALEICKLSKNQITALPETIGNWLHLNVLDVRDNRLTVVPKSLQKCIALQRLLFAKNRLKAIPSFITKLPWLKVLDMRGNKIVKIKIGQLSSASLDRLDLGDNLLEGNVSLDPMPHLEYLNLSGNRLSNIAPLPPRLKTLDLSRNQLSAWPKILEHLTRLRSLNLEHNKIKTLPVAFGPMTNTLETLQLKYNPVKCQPADLLPLRQLSTLTGLMPKKKFEQLFNFWREAQWRELPKDCYAPFFYLFLGKEKALLDTFTPLKWQYALNFYGGQIHQLCREFLLKKFGQSISKKRISGLCLMGHSSFDIDHLASRLSAQQINFTTTPNAETTHILLGFPKYQAQAFPLPIPATGFVLINEKQLDQFLNRIEKRYLWQETSPEKLHSLTTLLLHKDPANVKLGIQMLRGGGVPSALQAPLLAAYLKHPQVEIKAALKSLLAPMLKDKKKQLLIEDQLDKSRFLSEALTQEEKAFLQYHGFSLKGVTSLLKRAT